MSTIVLSRLDQARIKKWIGDARMMKAISLEEAGKLAAELDKAQIVDPEAMPADVVTMNSVVKISFLQGTNDKSIEFRIVYPDQANLKEHRISIFSPIATALIGYKVGDEIEWMVPAGMTKIRIDQILYQPEAAGDYEL